jgi:hypothetical protein
MGRFKAQASFWEGMEGEADAGSPDLRVVIELVPIDSSALTYLCLSLSWTLENMLSREESSLQYKPTGRSLRGAIAPYLLK